MMKDASYIISMFAQGKVDHGGNCASVALIKSALGAFDFKPFEWEHRDDYYHFRLRNSATYTLRTDQFHLAQQYHGFDWQIVTPQEQQTVELSYALMALVCQQQRGTRHYRRALMDLNHGESADYITSFLGLEKQYGPIIEKEKNPAAFAAILHERKNIVLYNWGHVVYASEGFYDEYGERADLNDPYLDFLFCQCPVQ